MQETGNISNGIRIQQNVSLQPFNTLAVPAKAEFLSRCSSLTQLIASLAFAEQQALPVIILGEGSNTVFSKDFDGLVILNRLTGINLLSQDSQGVVVQVAAGESWHDFVRYSLEHGWYGLENLALIPGLVGGAPIQNIGAYGVEVKDAIDSVSYLEIGSHDLKTLSNSECHFEYRNSIFKQTLVGQFIITSVTFRLSKLPALTLSYPALANYFDYLPDPMEVFRAVSEIRAAKLPMPDDIPNAGSFFKNPVVDSHKYAQLKKTLPSIVAFPLGDGGIKLAAGWLIESRGWKDKSVDAVYVHRTQALVIVNPNFKRGDAVLKLALAIQCDIQSAYGVTLEIEPKIY